MRDLAELVGFGLILGFLFLLWWPLTLLGLGFLLVTWANTAPRVRTETESGERR